MYRAKSATSWDAQFTEVATTKETTYSDDGITPGVVYFYRIAAIDRDGHESRPSRLARTQPHVPSAPVVSVVATDRVKINCPPHAAKDVVGYNLYRRTAQVDTVKRGAPKAWSDNDPEYPAPVVAVRDVTNLKKLNEKPLAVTRFIDTKIDLTKHGISSADYKHAVHAYIVRAVNRLGVESGPSPYALTIPSSPQQVMCLASHGTGIFVCLG